MVLEKTLESPSDYKEIKPVNLKGNQSWIFIGRTDTQAEVPIFWPPDAKSQLLENTLILGKIRQEEKVGWHHRLHASEFKQAPRDGKGQGSLVCCCPWGRKESDTTEWLNKNICIYIFLTLQCSLWDLSSPIRDGKVKALSPNHWTDREFPFVYTIYLLSF